MKSVGESNFINDKTTSKSRKAPRFCPSEITICNHELGNGELGH